MASFPNQEHRPLKKPRLGTVGPDIYLQDKKQKEDEMTHLSVKQGFSNQCIIKDEHGSAKDCTLNAAKVSSAFSAILARKQEISTFQDQSKKKLVINTKDNFWPAGLPRGKLSLESWFKDLSGTKPLTQLAKKVPVFNKKEEIFQKLFDDNVPIMRAAWFIKMTNAYNTAQSEAAKAKKRQTTDPFLEWTQALTKYLREQLQKILEHYQGSSGGSALAAAQSGFLTAAPTTIIDLDGALRQWNYGTQLAQHMYSEGLFDRHEFLSWIVELLEKVKITDDTVLKLVMAQVLKYMSEFVHSHMLSRRLAYFCCKKLSQLCLDTPCFPTPSPQQQSSSSSQSTAVTSAASTDNTSSNLMVGGSIAPDIGSTSAPPVNAAAMSAFSEFCNCPQHRSLLLCLSAVVQAIVLSCSSSLVWHNLGDGKSASPLSGSPLDMLPVSPSSLPMPVGNDNKSIRLQLQAAEEQIILRSTAAEVRWSSDKCQQSTKGQVISHVLNCLETIDKQNFDKVETSNSLDVLYHKLFAGRQPNKDENDSTVIDEANINLLLEWAVSTQRTGEHRAIVVAKLLEKYQNDIQSDKSGDGDTNDDRESTASELVTNTVPIFQNQLMQFLDKSAPVLEENPTVDNRQAFANLVQLFTEMMRHDVFSHDVYVCTLISRGDIQSSNSINAFQMSLSSVNPYQSDLSSVKSEGIKQEMMAVKSHEEMKMELECQNLDSEFGIFSFKEEAKSSPDRPASVLSSSMEQSIMGMTPSHAQVPTPSAFHGQNSARTPGAPMTPMSARTPGPPHTPGMAHTPGSVTPGGSSFHTSGGGGGGACQSVGMVHTPASVLPSTCGAAVPSSAERALGTSHRGPPRHLVFLTHFPIPNDDQFSSHESNQRMVVLYGVGRQRDEARHVVKKITKELSKLLGKKNCVDLSGGDLNIKTKKKKEKEGGDQVLNLDNTFSKFRKLCFYDQHAVTQTVAKILSETVSNFAMGSVSYLPQIDYVSFLFDLMEYCLNISRLLELAIQLLKDLPEVGNQLLSKTGGRMSVAYTTGLGLCVVGILRKYHASLLVSHEQTSSAFDSLCKIVKHVAQPSDCSSAERAILAYLYDLYTSCSHLKSKYGENFGGPCAKVKSTIYAEVKPSSSNLRWEEQFAKDLMDNPKAKIDPQFVKQLNDAPSNRYSFVCSALVNICCCQSRHNDRLNDISILCAELTACCNALSSEWLGVLKALCWSSDHDCGFIDVLTQVDVDFSIHDSLAVFTAVMIARHCFTLENLVRNVALQSLLAACPSVGSGGDPDAENGARLTCHLLLRLFQMMNAASSSSAADSKRGTVYVRSSCDRHLLEAAHHRISVGAVVAVLKALLMLGDSGSSEFKDRSSANKMDTELDVMSLLRNLDDDGDLGMNRMNSRIKGHMESAGLSEYAKHCLREICSQEWVRDKFLKETDQLFTADLLLDKMLSHRQAEHLVQMICYPGGLPSVLLSEEDDDDEEPEQRRHISRILHHVDQWSLRVSWLELQLMLKQASSSEMSLLLDNIAKATIEVFQQHTVVKQEPGLLAGQSLSSSDSGSSVWLIAPLIAKLSGHVQGRILKHAGQVLETSNSFWSAKNSKDRERYLQKSTMLLGNQPFLSLVLTCLRGQDEQRQDLLKSLHDQLDKFVTNAKENDRGINTDEKLQYMMQEALQLRLSLVGIMFDMIQRNNALTQEWATLLVQLISSGVVDIQNNGELFTIIVDMLSVLIHGTLASDISEKGEENKKVYQNLIRKLKKELGERKSASIDFVRQMLPLPKVYCEVIVYDPFQGGSGDSRGGGGVHKSGSDGELRKQGLQISRKERVSPWDILEGHKNPAPLNLSWFGTVRLERKPLKFEEQNRLLLYHTHSMKKPFSYFLEPIPLPQEDLEPPPEKFPDVKLAEHPGSMIIDIKQPHQQQLVALQSSDLIRLPTPPGSAGRPTKRSRAPRKPQASPSLQATAMTPGSAMTSVAAAQGRITGGPSMVGPYQSGPPGMTFVRPDMYPHPQGLPQNWVTYPQQQGYPPQMPQVSRGNYGINPREALRTVMRARPTTLPYMAGSAGANASWNTSPVRTPGSGMNRITPGSGGARQICIEPPTYGQQQSSMFQNVPGQGMVPGGAYSMYAQQSSSASQSSSMMETGQQITQQQQQQQFTASSYQVGAASGAMGGGPGGGGPVGGPSAVGSMQQPSSGQPPSGYMPAQGGNTAQQQQAQQTSFTNNSSRFGHMSGGLGGPGNMGAPSGMTASGVMGPAAGGPPGYNQPNLGRQAGGAGGPQQQQQLQGAPVGNNANYMHQRQRQAQQAAMMAQQQQQQQHMAAVQGHGGGAVQQQPNAAGLMMQRQMSNQQQQQQQQQSGNQYNPYNQFK